MAGLENFIIQGEEVKHRWVLSAKAYHQFCHGCPHNLGMGEGRAIIVNCSSHRCIKLHPSEEEEIIQLKLADQHKGERCELCGQGAVKWQYRDEKGRVMRRCEGCIRDMERRGWKFTYPR